MRTAAEPFEIGEEQAPRRCGRSRAYIRMMISRTLSPPAASKLASRKAGGVVLSSFTAPSLRPPSGPRNLPPWAIGRLPNGRRGRAAWMPGHLTVRVIEGGVEAWRCGVEYP